MECLDKFTSNFVDKTITEYSLKQNFPNPFNPKTKITFEVPEFTKVTLTVYDIRGRVVSSLANDYFDKGSYTVDFNAIDLPSGVYIYKLKAGNFSSTKRMLILK